MVQAERLAAIGQTIATLSHHIKNILQGIRGGSYLIEEGLKVQDAEVVRRGWTIVDKNQEKISNLVLDMLTFSKEREPDPVPSDLRELVRDVVELMQGRAREAGVELVMPDAGPPYELLYDPELMHRAVLNVVTNAIDACEKADQPRVTVGVQYDPQAGVARIEVRDNGAGIPEHDLHKVFGLFESRKGSRGTGLGLPVSQKILREHGGDIRVQSNVGEGSTFTLEFPAVLPDTTPDEPTLMERPTSG
jgi:signal transduction histidine kinase